MTTRLSLTGTMIVARDIAHAKILERLEAGQGLPQYIKDHPVYYAGPAKVRTCESKRTRPPRLLLTPLPGVLVCLGRPRRATRLAPSAPRPRGAWTPTSTASRCAAVPLGGGRCPLMLFHLSTRFPPPDFAPRWH